MRPEALSSAEVVSVEPPPTPPYPLPSSPGQESPVRPRRPHAGAQAPGPPGQPQGLRQALALPGWPLPGLSRLSTLHPLLGARWCAPRLPHASIES